MAYPNETARTSSTTANGTPFTDITVDPYNSGQTSRVLVPDSIHVGDPITLMIVAHGAYDLAANIHNAFYRQTRDRALDRGWVLISSDAHGNAWSSQAALDDYRRCYDWALDIWPIAHVLISGWSMGGLTAINLYGRDVIPKVRAIASIDGALSIKAAWDGNYKSQIRAAYGISSDGGDYAALTEGFDPSLADPTQWAGKRIFMTASPADTAIPKSLHSDVFRSRINTLPKEVVYVTGAGGHVTAANFFPVQALDFFEAALAAHAPPASAEPATRWYPVLPFARVGTSWVPVTPMQWTGTDWAEVTSVRVGVA